MQINNILVLDSPLSKLRLASGNSHVETTVTKARFPLAPTALAHLLKCLKTSSCMTYSCVASTIVFVSPTSSGRISASPFGTLKRKYRPSSSSSVFSRMNVLAVASVSLQILRSVLMRSGTLVLNLRTDGAPVPIETRQPSWVFNGAEDHVVFASAQRRRMGLLAARVLSLYI